MQKNNTYKNIDEYLLTEENHSIRNTKLQYCGLDFFDTITQEKRLL